MRYRSPEQAADLALDPLPVQQLKVGQVWLFESHLGQIEPEPVGEEQQLGASPPAERGEEGSPVVHCCRGRIVPGWAPERNMRPPGRTQRVMDRMNSSMSARCSSV